MTLLFTIAAASLVGSLHCAGMCGAFVAVAVGEGRRSGWLQLAYHSGRLATYSAMGMAAGAAGRLTDMASTMAGLQPAALALAGAMLMAFGLMTLARLWGWRLAALRPPSVLMALLRAAHRSAMRRPPVGRALMIGLFTTLLPCGWLYAFVAVAAGTASPTHGAMVMAAFWVGTLPILATLGAGVRAMQRSLGGAAQAITAAALVAVGLYMLSGRMLLDPQAMARQANPPASASQEVEVPTSAPSCCHGH